MKSVVILILVTLGSAAHADPTPTAEALYNEGQAAYDSADYTTAVAKWRASYDLSGENGLLFNIAQAYRLGGDCSSALVTYKRFLTLDPIAHGQEDSPNDQHVLAMEFMRELEPTCGWQMPVRERSNSRIDQPVWPAVTTAIVTEHDTRARPSRSLKVVGLATGGAGALSIAVGLAIGRHAASLADEVTRACAVSCDWGVQRRKDAAGRRDAVIGYTLDAVGIAAVVGGATMYYLGHRSAVSIAPRTREGGAVVSWSGAW